MHFTFRQLEIFVEAATDENFRQTAERLGISQPAVSKHIAALEAKAGGRLFSRNRGSIARLSPIGRSLLDRARVMLRDAQGVRHIAGPAGDEQPVLRVVAGTYIVDHLLRPALPKYYARSDMPVLELTVVESAREMLSLIRSGAADVALFTAAGIEDPDFTIERVREVKVALYASPSLVSRVSKLTTFDEVPIVMATAHSVVDDWFRAALNKVGIAPSNVVARSQFADVRRDLVLNGMGMGIMFEEEAAIYEQAGRLVRLRDTLDGGFRCLSFQRLPPGPHGVRALSFLRALIR